MKIALPCSLTLFFLLLCSCYLNGQMWSFDTDQELAATTTRFFSSDPRLQNLSELRGDHTFTARYKTSVKANLAFRSMANSQNRDRSRIFMNEANVAIRKGPLNLKLGKQIIKWGELSGFSNMDLANRYDYFDFIDTDDEGLGLWASMLKLSLGNTQLQMTYVPRPQLSRFYIDDNNWIKTPQYISFHSAAEPTIPARLGQFVIKDQQSLPSIFSWSVKTDINDLSLGLSYFRGPNDIQQMQTRVDQENIQIPVVYDIALQTTDLAIYNFTIQKLFGSSNVWSELGYIQNAIVDPENELVDDHYWSFSLGMDRAYLFDNPSHLLKLMLQWRHTFWVEGMNYRATDIDHVLDKCFIADVDFRFAYHWSVALRSALSYVEYGFLFNPSVKWYGDHWSIGADVALMSGSDQHFFGHYRENSRINITLSYQL